MSLGFLLVPIEQHAVLKFCFSCDFNRLKNRRVEMAGTVFTPSLEGMKHVKSENGVILTKPFLDVCKLILPVLGNWLVLLVYLCLIIIFTYGKCLVKAGDVVIGKTRT